MSQVEEVGLGRVMHVIAERARALLDARAAVVELEQQGELVVMAAVGDVPEGLVGRKAALRGTLAGTAISSGRVESLDVPLNRARLQRGVGRFGVKARSGLAAPLRLADGRGGVLLILDRTDDRDFAPQDVGLLEGLVAGAAVAAAAARELTNDAQLAWLQGAEEERRRWARELHDETLQGLAVVMLRLADARKQGNVEAIEQTRAALEQEIVNLRSLIRELRPRALDELGFEHAIESLADAASETGIQVRTELDVTELAGRSRGRDRSKASPFEISAYRIVQEALTNARKHAQATKVEVRVCARGSTLELEVHDDGIGLGDTPEGRGFGMGSMREHVDSWGGVLIVDSHRRTGTSIRAWLPVPAVAAPRVQSSRELHVAGSAPARGAILPAAS